MHGNPNVRLADLVQPHRVHVPVEPLLPAIKASIVQRDGSRCRLCHRASRLHVHHIDRRGELSPEPNHDPSNLVTLCARCHRLVHVEGITLTPELITAAEARRSGKSVNLPRAQRYREHQVWPETYAILNDPASNDGEPIHGGWWMADP